MHSTEHSGKSVARLPASFLPSFLQLRQPAGGEKKGEVGKGEEWELDRRTGSRRGGY